MGVEDLYDATAFLVDKAGALGIDPRRIAVSGGSAGAVNALTAEYLLCAGDTLARAHLPEGFGYGCVITFAGGVWTDAQGPLEWRVKPCPLLMFHGSDDPLVPYRTSPRARGAAHGVADIARQMEERRWPYALYTYDGYDHSVAGLPMFLNVDDMLSFLRRAERGENLLLDIHQRPGGRHDGAWMSATMQRYEAEHHTGKPF